MDLLSPNGTASRRLGSNASRLRRGMYVRHPATFVPTAFLRAMGGFDTRYRIATDFDLITRLRLAGAEFGW